MERKTQLIDPGKTLVTDDITLLKTASHQAKKRRISKAKKTELELVQLFWGSPMEAFFGQETIAIVTGRSEKTLECDRWRKAGILFRKVGGRVLYKKTDVINYLESFNLVSSTSEYKSQGGSHVA